MNEQDAQKIKKENEEKITKYGAEICDCLPMISISKQMRSLNDITKRALILNAMLNIYFKAPINIIKAWVINNGLFEYLSGKEREILEKNNEDLTEQEQINLYWYIEALWALLWAGKIIDQLPFDQNVEDRMANLCPNLQKNEDGSKFVNNMESRKIEEIYEMLDLYFRLHWYTRNCQLTRKDSKGIQNDVIIERRKALEWIYNKDIDWDNVELNT